MVAELVTEPAPELAIQTEGLMKSFKGRSDGDRSWVTAVVRGGKRLFSQSKARVVVDRVDLAVRTGEVFGIVGANGVGKTTLLKLLSCLLYPDGGGGSVNGYDILRERMDVRRSIAIARAGGGLGLLWQLNGRDNLLFRARLSGIAGAEAVKRVDQLLDRLDLARKARSYSWELSAGEAQKFSLAATFISRAPVVILDEPTSHLDPQAAREIREFIKNDLNQANGQTIILTTHYLEEADLLGDRVALMHGGRIIACDTPAELKRGYGLGDRLEFRARNYTSEIGQRVQVKCGIVELRERFEDLVTGQARLRPHWDSDSGDEEELRRMLEAEGVVVTAIRQVKPTLDDVYFHLIREQVK